MRKFVLKYFVWILLLVAVLSLLVINSFRLHTREEYMEHFAQDKEYFEELIDKAETYEIKGDHGIDIIYGGTGCREFGLNEYIRFRYRIDVLYLYSDNRYVGVDFPETVPGFEYAGIYYSSDGEPKDADRLTWDEERQMYFENHYNYTLEVWPLDDNWFYYQQHWYGGL